MEVMTQNDSELTKLEVNGVTILPSQFPTIVSEQVKSISILSNKMSEAQEKADEAKLAAERVAKMKVGLFNKKSSIEELQAAVISLMDAMDAMIDASVASQDSMRKIADAEKFLFAIGVSNLAANRAVVRELKLQLTNASEQELDDLARNELMNVLKQLQAQEDMSMRLESIEKKIIVCNESCVSLSQKINASKSELSSVFEQKIANLQNDIKNKDPQKHQKYTFLFVMGFVALLLAIVSLLYNFL